MIHFVVVLIAETRMPCRVHAIHHQQQPKQNTRTLTPSQSDMYSNFDGLEICKSFSATPSIARSYISLQRASLRPPCSQTFSKYSKNESPSAPNVTICKCARRAPTNVSKLCVGSSVQQTTNLVGRLASIWVNLGREQAVRNRVVVEHFKCLHSLLEKFIQIIEQSYSNWS